MRIDGSYVNYLKDEFKSRKLTNTSYSLRAFSRDIGVSVSRISEVFSGKSHLSIDSAKKIANSLKLTQQESELFISLIALENSSAKKLKRDSRKYLSIITNRKFESLSQDTFKSISDWYYFAILSVLELDECDGTITWIASRLNLSQDVISDALEKLDNLLYVDFIDNKYVLPKEVKQISTTTDIASLSLKQSHKQKLMLAIEKIDSVALENRDITSMTMAIDLKKMPEAKRMIKDFRRSLCSFMESGAKNEVFHLNIQFIPLTNIGEK